MSTVKVTKRARPDKYWVLTTTSQSHSTITVQVLGKMLCQDIFEMIFEYLYQEPEVRFRSFWAETPLPCNPQAEVDKPEEKRPPSQLKYPKTKTPEHQTSGQQVRSKT